MIPWHLYGFAFTGLLFLVLVGIAARRLGQRNEGRVAPFRMPSLPSGLLDGVWMFERRERLMTPDELEFLDALERVLRGKYRVSVRVHLGALLEASAIPDPVVRARNEAALNQCLDFVVFDPLGRVVGVIVFEGPSGVESRVGAGDGPIDAILASARIPLLRLSAGQAGDPRLLWKTLRDAFGIA